MLLETEAHIVLLVYEWLNSLDQLVSYSTVRLKP